MSCHERRKNYSRMCCWSVAYDDLRRTTTPTGHPQTQAFSNHHGLYLGTHDNDWFQDLCHGTKDNTKSSGSTGQEGNQVPHECQELHPGCRQNQHISLYAAGIERKVECCKHGCNVYSCKDESIRGKHALQVWNGTLEDTERCHERETSKRKGKGKFLRSHRHHGKTHKECECKKERRQKEQSTKRLTTRKKEGQKKRAALVQQ